MKRADFLECRIRIGGRVGADGWTFDKDMLAEALGVYQNEWENEKGWSCDLMVTRVTFVRREAQTDGFEVSILNNPAAKLGRENLIEFARGLSEFLLDHFQQTSVCLSVSGDSHSLPYTYILESKEGCNRET